MTTGVPGGSAGRRRPTRSPGVTGWTPRSPPDRAWQPRYRSSSCFRVRVNVGWHEVSPRAAPRTLPASDRPIGLINAPLRVPLGRHGAVERLDQPHRLRVPEHDLAAAA